MKIAYIIIIYNPAKETINYINDFSKDKAVYVIDNSNNITEFSKNITYIPLMQNTGIAKALNIGCEKAVSDGYDWGMTLDQDSIWNSENLESYISIAEKHKDQFHSFSPNIQLPKIHCIAGKIKSFFFKKKSVSVRSNEDESLFTHQKVVICSGNLINLIIWDEIGRFNEDLFIDEVDHEYCIRLISKYPNSIVKINSILMNHEIGKPKTTFFPRIDFHHGMRLYYMFRNGLYMHKTYPDFEKDLQWEKKLKTIFLQNIRDLYFRDLKYMIKGYRDYKKGIYGKYEN